MAGPVRSHPRQTTPQYVATVQDAVEGKETFEGVSHEGRIAKQWTYTDRNPV